MSSITIPTRLNTIRKSPFFFLGISFMILLSIMTSLIAHTDERSIFHNYTADSMGFQDGSIQKLPWHPVNANVQRRRRGGHTAAAQGIPLRTFILTNRRICDTIYRITTVTVCPLCSMPGDSGRREREDQHEKRHCLRSRCGPR